MAAPILSPAQQAFVAARRTATLATLDPEGQPRLVPICFVLGGDDRMGRPLVYTPIDEKPKASADPKQLARVRDLLILPAAPPPPPDPPPGPPPRRPRGRGLGAARLGPPLRPCGDPRAATPRDRRARRRR